jgi:hypothetical protein
MICSSVYRLFFIFSSLARLRENSSFNWQSFPGAGHFDAMLKDIRDASASHDAASDLMSRLKSICFGPIRCSIDS